MKMSGFDFRFRLFSKQHNSLSRTLHLIDKTPLSVKYTECHSLYFLVFRGVMKNHIALVLYLGCFLFLLQLYAMDVFFSVEFPTVPQFLFCCCFVWSSHLCLVAVINT